MSKDTEDADFSLPKKEIIRSGNDFTLLYKKGSQWTGSALRFFYIRSETRRIGFSVPKRIIKKAVQRNRIKRWLREIYRHHRRRIGPYTIVAAVKRQPEGYGELLNDFVTFCSKAGITE